MGSGNILPHNDDLEKKLLAWALFNEEFRFKILSEADPELFYLNDRGALFSASAAAPEIEPLILHDELLTRIGPSFGVSAEGLAELIGVANESAHPRWFTVKGVMERLRRLWERRAFVDLGGALHRRGLNGDVDPGFVESEVLRVQRYSQDELRLVSAKEEVMNAAEFGQTKQEEMVTGIETIDRKLGGLRRTDFVCVAARPNIGKTPFVMNVALNRANAGLGHQLIFSLEMPRSQVVQTLVSQQTGIPMTKLLHGGCDRVELDKIAETIEWLKDRISIFDPTSSGDVDFGLINRTIRTQVRIQADRGKALDLVVLDYIQLVGRKLDFANKHQYLASVSEGLKQLAIKLRIPVMAVASTNRNQEHRSKGQDPAAFVVPKMSDLAECGALEFDATKLFFLCEKTPTSRYFFVAKDRFGPKGLAIPIGFDYRCLRFHGRF